MCSLKFLACCYFYDFTCTQKFTINKYFGCGSHGITKILQKSLKQAIIKKKHLIHTLFDEHQFHIKQQIIKIVEVIEKKTKTRRQKGTS